jgi:hypothetical protein
MYHNSDVLGSSISSLSLAAETPEVYNSDAQSPNYGSFDDIGTFGGNNDQDSDGNMYHASTVFGSSQYSASLAAESPEVYNSDAQSPIYDDYGTFGGNSDRDSDGNMDDDDDEDYGEHLIDDDVFNAVVSCCRSLFPVTSQQRRCRCHLFLLHSLCPFFYFFFLLLLNCDGRCALSQHPAVASELKRKPTSRATKQNFVL